MTKKIYFDKKARGYVKHAYGHSSGFIKFYDPRSGVIKTGKLAGLRREKSAVAKADHQHVLLYDSGVLIGGAEIDVVGSLPITGGTYVGRIDKSPDRGNWTAAVKSWVSSFRIAAETADLKQPSDVSIEFTINLAEIDAELTEVTGVVTDEMKAVTVPERWVKRLEMKGLADSSLVRFSLTSSRPANLELSPADLVKVLKEVPRDAAGHRQRPKLSADVVELETTTGPLEYTLPISLEQDTITSMEVSTILSQPGKVNRAIAGNRRKEHRLLGLPLGNTYRYPVFQFESDRKRINPIVEYANRELECDDDPWGTLDWWFSENEMISDESPIDRLVEQRLTEEDVDRMVRSEQIGMD
ncbi:hypothetical protein QM806_33845 [Rhodococcus sp. IEGM 1351]|uniref:hypothetical protein n=1 Tax=Rhodococcus sp. IEGM 1351 TaxID=3047089 RepID=UPI0024B7B6F3|nr:hypothetical protein [Rhodococcus sp. IEGM 1351]MDI9940359.1 hypothetical protein [Rhodococcus sp. IEGM 1351]